MVRILLTNDDGIDSVGLHVLARAMREHGEVVVAAPDSEYSGSSASFGALHEIRPEVHRLSLDGLDEVWSVTGPPALCVMFARLGAFGEPFDLVVAGINPGANVGRSIYHSGTVGAATTARNGGISGVAVSQAVTEWGFEGQGWEEMLVGQKWDTAASVASTAVGALVADMPAEPLVLNLNVPNTTVDELAGWRHTHIAQRPPRAMSTVHLDPKPGHEGSFRVRMDWGKAVEVDEASDSGAVMAGYVSVSWLGRMNAERPDEGAKVDVDLSAMLGPEAAAGS